MATSRTFNLRSRIGSDMESINSQGQQAIEKLENIRDLQVPKLRDTIRNNPHMVQAEKDADEAELDAIAQTLIDRIVALHDSVTT